MNGTTANGAAAGAARDAGRPAGADSTRPLRVVFLDAATMPGGLPLHATAHVDYEGFDVSRGADVAVRMRDADVVITNKVRIGAEQLRDARRLRLIAVAAAGTDIIDHDAARAHGVAVRNVPDYGSDSVAEHALAVLFALRRHLGEYQAAARDGRWSASPHFCWHGSPIRDLHGSTLGLIGWGRIGQALAGRAQALGIHVLRAQLPGRPAAPGAVPLADVLSQADAVSLHVPLTPQTRGLIDAAALAAMKPDAVLINTGRGALVDAPALAAALRAGRLGGAAIDVLDVEPPPPDHPLLAADIPNLIVTPHSAWASVQAQARLARRLADWVEAARRAVRDGTALPDTL